MKIQEGPATFMIFREGSRFFKSIDEGSRTFMTVSTTFRTIRRSSRTFLLEYSWMLLDVWIVKMEYCKFLKFGSFGTSQKLPEIQ
ncbi:unnamed protein product, partial [Nesidiocoris tenuis]